MGSGDDFMVHRAHHHLRAMVTVTVTVCREGKYAEMTHPRFGEILDDS